MRPRCLCVSPVVVLISFLSPGEGPPAGHKWDHRLRSPTLCPRCPPTELSRRPGPPELTTTCCEAQSMADERQLLDLIATNSQGILAGVTRAGYPHLTNVLYMWDAAERTARVSTTADRVKGRILRRDPRAALHVSGPHFWSYAVAECDADVSKVATT